MIERGDRDCFVNSFVDIDKIDIKSIPLHSIDVVKLFEEGKRDLNCFSSEKKRFTPIRVLV